MKAILCGYLKNPQKVRTREEVVLRRSEEKETSKNNKKFKYSNSVSSKLIECYL